MEKKSKIITTIGVTLALTLMTSYFIYEATVPEEYSLASKISNFELDSGVGSGDVTDIKFEEPEMYVYPSEEPFKVNYNIKPSHAGNQSVKLTASNEDSLVVKGDSLYVKPFAPSNPDYGKPVTLKIQSLGNPEIYDECSVFFYKEPVTDIHFNYSGLGIDKGVEGSNTHIFETNVNGVFRLNFWGFNPTAPDQRATEELEITYSPNITKIYDDKYFVNANDGNPCFIQASSYAKTVTVVLEPKAALAFEEPDGFRLFKNDEPYSKVLNVNDTYTVKPFKGSNIIENYPFKISCSDNLKQISNDTFKVIDSGDVKISITDYKNKTITLNHDAVYKKDGENNSYDLVNFFNQTGKPYTYVNHSGKIKISRLYEYSYNKFTLTSSDENVLSVNKISGDSNDISNLYLKGLNVGKTTIEIKSIDENYSEFNKSVEIEVKPLTNAFTFNENIYFGILFILYGILIATFFLLFVMNKKYLKWMPISYAIGLVLVGIISLISLASPFRIFSAGTFGLFTLMCFIGISIFYIGCAIYHQYNDYKNVNE